MDRRDFLRFSSLALLPLLRCKPRDDRQASRGYGVTISSDREAAHWVFEAEDWPLDGELKTRTLVVGGGMAGVAAAYQLRHEDWLLCELSEQLGGTSGAVNHQGLWLSQGAHYDLVYPGYFGERPLRLLEEIGTVRYDGVRDLWRFVEEQYLVDWDGETRCLDGQTYRERMLRPGPALEHFERIIRPFVGHLKLPTVEIDPAFHYLNELTFKQFLEREGVPLSPYFSQPIDYQMRDDWGGTMDEVSALAGVYYYASRPPGEAYNQIISPPSGNYYFLDKIRQSLDDEQIKLQHLVKSIQPAKQGFRAEVLDVKQQRKVSIMADRIVYAGQKHALKYVFPPAYPLFAEQVYTPWLVVSLVLHGDLLENSFWQNETLIPGSAYIGFVDSDQQYLPTDQKRVLTAYYCFRPQERKTLANIHQHQEALVCETISHINHYLEQDIEPYIEHVYLKAMGHAMAIPKPGFLLRGITAVPGYPQFGLAGVDGGRLPLMVEALDSGIMAANQWGSP